MRTNRKRQGGFTLIELITVIIILGILAAVITPRYFNMANEASTAALEGAVSEGIARFNMAYARYMLDNSAAPADITALTAADYLGTTLTNIDIGDYTLSYSGGTGDPVADVSVSATDGTNTSSKSVPWPDTN